MKKAIPIIIVIGMLGWALFDFLGSSTEEDTEERMAGNSITSPPIEDTEEEPSE